MSKNILNGSLRLIWDWVGHFFSTLKSSGELLKYIDDWVPPHKKVISGARYQATKYIVKILAIFLLCKPS